MVGPGSHNSHCYHPCVQCCMEPVEDLERIPPEQCGIQGTKTADTQDFNNHLFYDLIRLKIIPATSAFTDLISNYNLVVYIIVPLYMKIVHSPKEPIVCILSTFQNIINSVMIVFGYFNYSYRLEKRTIPLHPTLLSSRERERTNPGRLVNCEHYFINFLKISWPWSLL